MKGRTVMIIGYLFIFLQIQASQFSVPSTFQSILPLAHRLSTIKNADVIAVLARGHVVEQGSHLEVSFFSSLFFLLNLPG